MAFRKTANARLATPFVGVDHWHNFRDRAKGRVKIASNKTGNLVHRATEIFGSPFNPDDHLLTHCTIVCSVDTQEVSRAKLGGSVVADGQRINRKWADFQIKPECDKFINNNLDAWSRKVIMASFPTFIGAHNFVEHVQVEDLSKGRVIDACVRDIGPSLYVDILVATNRKHRELVAAINNGKLGTLSMGCSVLATICTKCGNVAADDTELCSHVRYLKGNKFHDENGNIQRVAELCGHAEMNPTAGVHFIEASWVASPAFPGAVMRNVIESPGTEVSKQAEEILNTLPPQWDDQNLRAAASAEMPTAAAGYVQTPGSPGVGENSASFAVSDASSASPGSSVTVTNMDGDRTAFNGFDAPGDDGGGGDKGEKSPLEKAKDEVYQALVDDARQRALKEIREKDQEQAVSDGELGTSRNENVNHQAADESVARYRAGVAAFMRTARNEAEFINNLALFNESLGISIPIRVYRASLRVGPLSHYPTEGDFLGACHKAMGLTQTEVLSPPDRNTLLRIGKLLTLRSKLGR